jgi:bifunctional UDP-N-acetylglucosamine pyrophosphorylase / glucosamine-1-phosphate N-acetyltransferase
MTPVPSTSARSAPSAIILAAGMGKRMQSDLPKVLHPIGNPPRPMVCAVIDACREAGCERIVLVVGHRQELVREAIAAAYGANHTIEFGIQPEQLGTGHAVRCVENAFFDEKQVPGHDVFVLAGDGPLIRSSTLTELLTRHRAARAAATLATSVIADPTGYGRIVRDAGGQFAAIVEHKECTPEQLKIREVNPSYYCFDCREMFEALAVVRKNPITDEYYITDVPALLLAQGKRVEVIPSVPPEDVLSINTPEQLAEVDAIYQSRNRGAGASPGSSGNRTHKEHGLAPAPPSRGAHA